MQMKTIRKWVVKFMSDKIGFQAKAITKDKEEHYIPIKGSIQKEDITFVNICVPQIGAPKYRKQISTYRKKMDNNTIILGGLNILLWHQRTEHTDRKLTRQKWF